MKGSSKLKVLLRIVKSLKSLKTTDLNAYLNEMENTTKKIVKWPIDGTLSTDYGFNEFIDEILRCFTNANQRYNQYRQRVNLISKDRGNDTAPQQTSSEQTVPHSNPFKDWVTDKEFRDEVFYVLPRIFYQLDPESRCFSFLTTQVIRLFYMPTRKQINYLRGVLKNIKERGLCSGYMCSIANYLNSQFENFSGPPTQKEFKSLKPRISNLTNKILRLPTTIASFQTINNSLAWKRHSSKDTEKHLQSIPLEFSLLPHDAYAHTDYKKKIYLAAEYFPREETDYRKIIISVVSLVHEVAHAKRIISTRDGKSPLEFSPQKLRYEAGDHVEYELFTQVVSYDDITEEDAAAIFQDPNSGNLVEKIREVLRKKQMLMSSDHSQHKYHCFSKD